MTKERAVVYWKFAREDKGENAYFHPTGALSFVIPSEAEGSAVSLPEAKLSSEATSTLEPAARQAANHGP
jgi:hypothetical protein